MHGANVPDASIALTPGNPPSKDHLSMLTESASRPFATNDTEPTDRSMLILQYVTALIAGLAAVLMAVLR